QEARGITPEHINALESVLLRDGRGTVLLVADPQTPASELESGLLTLISARVKTIELAVHEPRLDGEGSVVVALPLHVVYEGDLGPGARALREARIEVELTGRGPRFRVDGRLLSATPALPSDVQRTVADLHRAYPRERVINLSIGGDVQPQQLVDLLASLTGGINPLFLAAGMVIQPASAPKPGNDPAADRALTARLALLDANPTIAVQANASLSEDDRARVEQAAATLRECVPELETALPKQGVTLTLEFTDGKLGKPRAAGKRVDAAALGRFEACASDRLLGFHLRDTTSPASVTLLVR
ncbi:MAG TPA: hypothetical protein VM869_33285, partial [Enhygromyxa sp.]|nr:hypothetical protein [Enhygromyxa sp.]